LAKIPFIRFFSPINPLITVMEGLTELIFQRVIDYEIDQMKNDLMYEKLVVVVQVL